VVASARHRPCRSPDGDVTTLAGTGRWGSDNGTGTTASFTYPFGVAVDAGGNVYVGDYGNHLIRKISPAAEVTTLAGSGEIGSANGIGSAASFNYPAGLALDAIGNLYVPDYDNHLIRKVSPSGAVTTLAGTGVWGRDNGSGTAASFHYPTGVAVDADGLVYVADSFNHMIRKMTPSMR